MTLSHFGLRGLFFLLTLCLGPLIAQDSIKPLEDALWQGTLRLEVTGPQYLQFLANSKGENGQTQFIKEKGEMVVDLVLEIQFVINASGEFESLTTETFHGKYEIERQKRYMLKEEFLRAKVKYEETIHVAEDKLTTVHFDSKKTYDREHFQTDGFRFLPSGRLDKKGEIQIVADMLMTFEGKGTYTETYERQPASEEFKNTRKEGEVNKTYELPLSFDVTIDLEGKPTNGVISATSVVKSPFLSDEDYSGREIYRNNQKIQGSYQMTPLFAKKK